MQIDISKMTNIKYVTLFGGAMNITDSPEYVDTIAIGKLLGEKGYVVKSGGYGGMMEAVSKGASEAGATVLGYTCGTFRSTQGNQYLTHNTVAKDIYDRLRYLISDSELLIFQKGGVGTFAELFLALDEIRKRKDKPKVILIGLFWIPIMESVSVNMTEKEKSMYIITENYETFKELI